MEKINAKEVLQFVAAVTGMMAELHEKISTADLRKCITNKPFLKQRLMEVFGSVVVQPKLDLQQEVSKNNQTPFFSKVPLEGKVGVYSSMEPFDFEAEKEAIKIDWTKSWADWTEQEECFPSKEVREGRKYFEPDNVSGYQLRRSVDNTSGSYDCASWSTWFRRFFNNENL